MKYLKPYDSLIEDAYYKPQVGDYILMKDSPFKFSGEDGEFFYFITHNIGQIIEEESPNFYIAKYKDNIPDTSIPPTTRNTIKVRTEEIFKFSPNIEDIQILLDKNKFNI